MIDQPSFKACPRLRSGLVVLAFAVFAIGGCGRGIEAATSTSPSTTEPRVGTAITEPGEEVQFVHVAMPIIPPIVLPDISILSETGDLVGEKLGDLVTPASGMDLISATCAEEGGSLTYSGSTGSDVFDIEQDGSGVYKEESENGLVTLRVDADGSGQYYDNSSGGLVTIKVQPDGSGEYYTEQAGGLVTVKSEANGSGVYYDSRDDAVLTVTLHDTGSGQYFREDAAGLMTINAGGDGSGEFFHSNPETGLITIRAESSGEWKLTNTSSSRLIELTVGPDGSGAYRQTGLTPVAFDFDSEGHGLGHRINVPARPRFAVAASFPPVGKLGSLTPPCATIIRFDDHLLFASAEADIRPEAGQVLDQVVLALNEANKPIEINGHTDSVGSDEYNLDLSLRRAKAVEAALRERGLTVDIEVEAFGEARPIAPNLGEAGRDDPVGQALNRRVEILIRE